MAGSFVVFEGALDGAEEGDELELGLAGVDGCLDELGPDAQEVFVDGGVVQGLGRGFADGEAGVDEEVELGEGLELDGCNACMRI